VWVKEGKREYKGKGRGRRQEDGRGRVTERRGKGKTGAASAARPTSEQEKNYTDRRRHATRGTATSYVGVTLRAGPGFVQCRLQVCRLVDHNF